MFSSVAFLRRLLHEILFSDQAPPNPHRDGEVFAETKPTSRQVGAAANARAVHSDPVVFPFMAAVAQRFVMVGFRKGTGVEGVVSPEQRIEGHSHRSPRE